MAISPVQLQSLAPQGRVNRNPRHTFLIRQKPYAIQPFLIAPVLPGETLKNGLIQARVITDPIKNQLVGWWHEYYIFYVKHRDLDDRATLETMMLDADADMSGLKSTAALSYHYFGGATSGAINWSAKCYKRVVEEYFRDEGEAYNNVNINNLSAAKIGNNGIADSIRDATTVPVGGDPSSVTEAQDLETLMTMYEFLRAQNMINMTYEDYLKSYGVRSSRIETNKPELLRYLRDWQYPSNHVGFDDSSVTSAVSWAIQERMDKDRYFTEPGFIYGVTVTRPKVHLWNQRSHASSILDSALKWLPAIMRDEIYTSIALIDKDDGPFAGITNDYWLDVRDLFMHGDQFINFTQAGVTDASGVALPTAALQTKYPAEADVNALFVGANNMVRQDGVVSLTIAGTQKDHT